MLRGPVETQAAPPAGSAESRAARPAVLAELHHCELEVLHSRISVLKSNYNPPTWNTRSLQKDVPIHNQGLGAPVGTLEGPA